MELSCFCSVDWPKARTDWRACAKVQLPEGVVDGPGAERVPLGWRVCAVMFHCNKCLSEELARCLRLLSSKDWGKMTITEEHERSWAPAFTHA